MRTEQVTPVTARKGEPNPEPAAAPRRDGRMAFEAALRRAGRGPLGEEPDADAPPRAEPAMPAPMTRPADPAATPWAPQAVRAPDALTRQLQAEPDITPVSGRWQLQILQSGLPVQSFDVQHHPTGPLNVVLTARPEAQRGEPSERLRQRLAARSGAPATLDFRAPAQEQDE